MNINSDAAKKLLQNLISSDQLLQKDLESAKKLLSNSSLTTGKIALAVSIINRYSNLSAAIEVPKAQVKSKTVKPETEDNFTLSDTKFISSGVLDIDVYIDPVYRYVATFKFSRYESELKDIFKHIYREAVFKKIPDSVWVLPLKLWLKRKNLFYKHVEIFTSYTPSYNSAVSALTNGFIQLVYPDPNWETAKYGDKILSDYQIDAVKFFLLHTIWTADKTSLRGCILGDSAGLGKTLPSIVAAKIMQQLKDCHVMVICPPILIDQWEEGMKDVRLNYSITSWQSMKKLGNPTKPYIVIADELHQVSNIQSDRAKQLLKLSNSKNCVAVWGITATSVSNGQPKKIFPLLKAIGHPLSFNRRAYEIRYCDAYMDEFERWNDEGSSNLQELSDELSDCILRREKEDYLDLPQKVTQVVRVKPTSKQLAEYKSISEFFSMVEILRMRQYSSLCLVPHVCDLIETKVAGKALIFTNFSNTVDALMERLGNSAEAITGKVTKKKRQQIIERFNTDYNLRYLVLSVGTAAVGLNLTVANYVLFVDRHWNPIVNDQATDRSYRRGQDKSVHVFYFNMFDIDEVVQAVNEKKQDTVDIILNNKVYSVRDYDDLIKQLEESTLEMIKENANNWEKFDEDLESDGDEIIPF